jgi:hypothetical protein
MKTYNRDEWFQYTDTENKTDEFYRLLSQLKHFKSEELEDLEVDHIRIRKHFIEVKTKRLNPDVSYMNIEVAYFKDLEDDVSIHVVSVTIYENLAQWTLYKSMEGTVTSSRNNNFQQN